jgi:deazaflavin-dependent oxidoreductase (nitroreductase family)
MELVSSAGERDDRGMRAVRAILLILGGLAVAVAVPLAVVIVGVRSGNRRFIRVFTRLQRDRVNPSVLATAGSPGDEHAVIEHVGRTSGTAYETPIVVLPDGDHWVISLPYGEGVSWARNVLAAGEAFVRVDGTRIRMTDPEVVPVGGTVIARENRISVAVFGIRSALRLREAD